MMIQHINSITTTEPKSISKESGHWYDAKTGEPRYTIIGANGQERATTLRDARKFGYVPSVTTIVKILDKPGLANWIADQIIMASLTLPRNPNEADADYIARIKEDSNEKRDKAAARGTALHTDIELYCQGKPHGHEAHIEKLVAKLAAIGIDLRKGRAEHSFAHPDGFGGKIDWFTDEIMLDFKSKDKIEDGKKLAYDEHFIQLAAYSYGTGINPKRHLNVFVGVDDQEIAIVEHHEDEVTRGLIMFKLLLALWKVKNRI